MRQKSLLPAPRTNVRKKASSSSSEADTNNHRKQLGTPSPRGACPISVPAGARGLKSLAGGEVRPAPQKRCLMMSAATKDRFETADGGPSPRPAPQNNLASSVRTSGAASVPRRHRRSPAAARPPQVSGTPALTSAGSVISHCHRANVVVEFRRPSLCSASLLS